MDELSFWKVPDWKKESSLNPNFLMVVIAALFVLSGVTVCSFAYRAHLPVKEDVDELEKKISSREDKVSEVKRFKKHNQQIVAKLKSLKENRKAIVWSPQLASFARNLPENIVFRRLTIKAERMTVERTITVDGKKQSQQISKTRYRFRITGRSRGDNGREDLTAFSQKIQDSPPMGKILQKVEIPQVRKRTNHRNNTYFSFRLDGIYKPM